MDSHAHYLERFTRSAVARSADPRWLAAKREAALADFERLGFPSQKLEDWRYTNIHEIAEAAFELPTQKEVHSAAIALSEELATYILPDGLRLVFIDGIFCPELSVTNPAPTGLVLCNLRSALQSDRQLLIEENLGTHLASETDGFTALNTAMFQDGAFVHLAQNLAFEHPIQILHFAGASGADRACFPRNLYLLEPNSQAKIFESFVSFDTTRSFCSASTEIVLSRNAKLEQVRIQREASTAFHVATTSIHQDESSSFSATSVALGGKLTRHNLQATLLAEGSECRARGLLTSYARNVVDQHTLVTHEKPHCTSQGYFKCILADHARGVFNGRVIVQPNAQKTSSLQSSKNLLLSDGAEIDSKPELIIYADDVKCSHGSTTGTLNEDSLFYLRSRGIAKSEAKNLLTRAFAAEITEQIPSAILRDRVDAWLADYFLEHFAQDAPSMGDTREVQP